MTEQISLPGRRSGGTDDAAMVRRMTSPVAKRTAVLLSMLLIIIAGALGWWALTTIKAEVTEGMSRSLRTVWHTSIEAMDIWLEDQQDVLRTHAADPRLATLVAGQLERHNRGDQLLLSAELEGLRRLFSDFQETSRHIGFFVVAPDSTNIASMRNTNIGWVNLIQEQRPDLLARAFAGETVLVPPIVSDLPLPGAANVAGLDRPPSMFFATPIRDAEGEVLAVLAERFDPHGDFTSIHLLGRIGDTGETYSFDRQARLLSESRFLADLVAAGLIQPGEQGVLSVEVRDPGVNLVAGFTDAPPRQGWPHTRMAASALRGEVSLDVDGYRDYRGVTVFGVWGWLETFGFGMTTEIDAAEALEGYYSARAAIIVILAITVAVAIAFTSWLLVLASRADRSLRAAHELDQLVAEVSAALLRVPASEVGQQVDVALQRIGGLLSLDRATVWWLDKEKEKLRRTHSWVRSGVGELPLSLELSQAPDITSRVLRSEEGFRFSRVDELPPEAKQERELFERVKTRSYLSIPVKVGASLVGTCGFATVRKERDWPSEVVSRLTVLSQTLASAVARTHADEALRERLALEQLVAEVSARFAGLSGSEIGQQIDLAMRRLGESLDVDRVVLLELAADATVWKRTHGWLREGSVVPPPEKKAGALPLLEAAVFRGEIFGFSSVEDLPERALERERAVKEGVRSYLLIPLRVGESLVGGFAISKCRSERSWPDQLVRTLQVIGELFASVRAREQTEDELLASGEQLRALASEMVTLEERERRQMAIYLHDQIAQTLAVTRMKLGNLGTIVDSVDALRGIDEIRDLLEEAIDDIQEITFDLSPPILYELGLAPAIDWIGEKLAGQHGFRLDMVNDGSDWELDSDTSALLFRATREILMNVVKHAEAKRVLVSLEDEDGTLRITVEDDGVGFEPSILDPRSDATSFGMSSVRERMASVGGRVEVDSRPGAGTQVRLIVPMPDDPQYSEGVLP